MLPSLILNYHRESLGKDLESFGKFMNNLESFGKFMKNWESFGKFRKDSEKLGKFRKKWERFGKVPKMTIHKSPSIATESLRSKSCL